MGAGGAEPLNHRSGGVRDVSGIGSDALLRFHKPLLAVSSGIFALGVISASVVSAPDAPFDERRRTIERAAGGGGPLVVDDAASTTSVSGPTEPLDLDLGLGATPASSPQAPPPLPAPRVVEPPPPVPAPPPSPLDAVPDADVEEQAATAASVDLGVADLGAAVGVADAGGAPCPGATLEPGVTIGCPPPPPPEPAGVLTVIITGPGIGTVDQPLTIVVPIRAGGSAPPPVATAG